MMKLKKLNALEQKIVDLQEQKKNLRLRTAHALYKKLEAVFGEQFSPELVMGLVAENYPASTDKIKKWQEVGATFFRPSQPKKTTKHQSQNPSAGTTKITDETLHAN